MSGKQDAVAGAGLSLDIDVDGIGSLEFDQPGSVHNRLTPGLIERFVALVAEVRGLAEQGRLRCLIVASGKRDSFVAGLDVGVIGGLRSAAAGEAGARQGQLAFQSLAELPITTVAAINGTCLGGGIELALACDYRIAANDPAVEIGFPEVNLGIVPGFGGTQRLPRLLSLERALPMILTGRSADAQRALRIGLVDAVVPAPLLRATAIQWGVERPHARPRRVAPEDRPLARRLRRWAVEGNPVGRALVFRQASVSVAQRAKGQYPAPTAALAAVRQGLRGSLDRGLKLEAATVGELVVHEVTRNLVGIFFLRQAARRDQSAVADGAAVPVRRLGVLGAGVMGGGIAQLAAYRDVAVRMKDISMDSLRLAMGVAFDRFEDRRRRRKVSRREVRRGMGLISPTLDNTGFRHADLIIEAVVENIDVKHEVLAAAERASSPHTVLATNTSSLTVAAMATALSDASRFVGLHFFNPVHRMPLVEVVRGPHSSTAAIATASAFAVSMGKVPVVVADSPGFFVNRVLTPYLNEALLLLEDGATILQIDGALEEFGMPMGPLRLLDEIGLDVAAKVAAQLSSLLGERGRRSESAVRVYETGRRGRKSGAGFYRYGVGEPPQADPDVERLVRQNGNAEAAESIVDRCVLAMLAESARALGEGIVASPQAADLALVFGTGFAPFRGGIFRYADARGRAATRSQMQDLAAQLGARFEPTGALAGDEPFYSDAWPHKVDVL